MKKQALSGHEADVLAAIQDGAWNVTAISSRMGISIPRLYPVLAQLERKGRIVSHYDSNAQRRRYGVKK